MRSGWPGAECRHQCAGSSLFTPRACKTSGASRRTYERRQRRAVHIRIKEPDTPANFTQRKGQVRRDRRLAHSALAAADADQGADVLQRRRRLVPHEGAWPRSRGTYAAAACPRQRLDGRRRRLFHGATLRARPTAELELHGDVCIRLDDELQTSCQRRLDHAAQYLQGLLLQASAHARRGEAGAASQENSH